MKGTLIRTIILLTLLLTGYYFVVLRPQPNNSALAIHHATLLQNRLYLVELTRLDETSPNFDPDRTNLVGLLRETNRAGLEQIQSDTSTNNADLLNESSEVYNKQTILLDKVFETKSYEEGVEILTSTESAELLTEQTNLILKLEFLLQRSD